MNQRYAMHAWLVRSLPEIDPSFRGVLTRSVLDLDNLLSLLYIYQDTRGFCTQLASDGKYVARYNTLTNT
jgi:hypothetical protein